MNRTSHNPTLRYAPGISTENKGGAFVLSNWVNIRGFSSSDNYYDGLMMPMLPGWNVQPQIDPVAIERLEISKGLSDIGATIVHDYESINSESITQVTLRCRIQSLIFCSSSRKRTQRNDLSFPSSLTMKWDRIWAPKGEFN
jgi:hypothetical protein